LNRITSATTKLNYLFSSNNSSRFRQNFVTVAKANLLTQVIALLATPILTRLYSPADFGVSALFFLLTSLLLAFSTWRFDWSVPNTESRTQATALLLIGFIALMCFSLITLFVICSFKAYLTFWKGFLVIGPFLLLLPIAMVGGGMNQLIQAWFIREASLKAVSRTKIVQSITGTGLKVAGGITGLGAFGIIVSSVVSIWVGIGLLFRFANGLRESVTNISFIKIKADGLQFWQESTLSTLVSIFNIASLTAGPLLFAQYYSTTEVGWYTLMYGLALAPIGMITEAIGQSFWGEAVQLVKIDLKALRALYIRTTKRLMLASLPILIICAAGPLFIGPLLGKTEWEGASFVLPAIIPMVFGSIVFSPTNHLIVFGKQHLQLVGDITRLLLMIIALIIARVAMVNFITAVLLISLSSLIGHIILFIMHIKVRSIHG
jgi:O-antigen/teichoic acid export membrane protein